MNVELRFYIENKLKPFLDADLQFDWQRISGGSINETYKISTLNQAFFVKTNTISNFENGFKEEVMGLEFLASKECIIPKIMIEGRFNNTTFLILEWVESSVKSYTFWKNFALDLARLHQNKSEYFGLEYSNFMGRLKQDNTLKSNFVDFFIQNRMIPQIKMAFNKGLLDKTTIQKFEKLYLELPNIFPVEKPSALHGDLWSGNFLCNSNEKVVFIDPAVYYGHRELDLAMTLLFGGFSEEFYSIYHEEFPLEQGFFDRKDIYNLYPLLIHLNLFGSSYFPSIKAIIGDY